MTSTTTGGLGLPYPDGTDLVIGGDDAIEALAVAVEARLRAPGVAQIEEANVGTGLAAGALLIGFPGAVTYMDGFAWDGSTLTYQGATRLFVVYAQVEIKSGPGAAQEAVSSLVELRRNYVADAFASSYDEVIVPQHAEDPTSTVIRRYVHTLCVPVQLESGNTLQVFAGASAAGSSVGVGALRVFPIGPANAS